MSSFFSTIKKGWWAFDLPDYRSSESTYAMFSYEELPPIDTSINNNFDWLSLQSSKEHSLSENAYPTGQKTDLSKIVTLQKNQELQLPNEFILFIQSASLQSKVRSCTDCYLELHDFIVRTQGAEDGFLVHFLSDSQYILHWFLYINSAGEHCILASEKSYKVRSYESAESINIENEPLWFCSPSFKVFIYRFWLENEIWFTFFDKDRELTVTENSYLTHYIK